jgi:Asp-tRNA(Asn)/Glu-tRNA(Gln) amidotransferase A subunit family amidase
MMLEDLDIFTERLAAFMPFTPLFNITGQPAASLPLHWNAEGLPIGVQFAGRYGDEATLFRLASQLEAAAPWRDKGPTV